MTFTPPNEKDIAGIFKQALKKDVLSIKRFPTGLTHYVYDVQTDAGRFALRVAHPEYGVKAFRAALYWYGKLKPMGIPLPEIYYEDIEAQRLPFHCYIMERFEGRDLWMVYPDMNTAAKEKLAEQIVDMQNKVGTLPLGKGFGWTFTDQSTDALKPRWLDYAGKIEEKRTIIERLGIFPVSYVDELEKAMAAHRAYFDQVKPVPFLDDIQGKNVIINERHELSGVVDVDGITYGDRIFNIALTRMALLADTGIDPADYIDMLSRKTGMTADGKEALRLYTMQFCVDFMSEVGRAFNKDRADVDPVYVEQLKKVFASLQKSVSLGKGHGR